MHTSRKVIVCENKKRRMALEKLEKAGFQVVFLSHARAILEADFPGVLDELEEVLLNHKIPVDEIVAGGGGEAKVTQRIRLALTGKGWRKGHFEIKKTINGFERESQSHEVDHIRVVPNAGVIACEIEWNNKDPFYDRDLENFKRLHAEGAISAGIIITRGISLQENLRELVRQFALKRNLQSMDDIRALNLNPTPRQQRVYEQRVKAGMPFADAWSSAFVADKFGQATTHWRKLEDRINRGVGNPCPLLLIGLPASIVEI